ncbi:MAG: hypothetical protein AAFN77_07760 [Planctomycetota bacterium]
MKPAQGSAFEELAFAKVALLIQWLNRRAVRIASVGILTLFLIGWFSTSLQANPIVQDNLHPIEEVDPAGELADVLADSFNGNSETDSGVNGPVEGSHEALIRKRMVTAAILIGGLIVLLGVLFAYLRMEHITRGFYSARLQTVAVLTVLVVVLVCYLLWRWLA